MILIKPSASIISMTSEPLKLIELAGRTCYKSEERITDDSCIEFAEMIINRGHESVLEHASATVKFIVDRGVSHELVRHRIASFSQESTRYCNYNKGEITFIIPNWLDLEEGKWVNEPEVFEGFTKNEVEWLYSMFTAESYYKTLSESGWKPEQARSVLPNSLKTEIIVTQNFRQWRHFFKLRTSKAAHPSMREVTIPLLNKFKEIIPIVFDDIFLDF